MKKALLLIPVLFLLMASCSKEKDLCDGVVCENGSSCHQGTCVCVNGYTGTHCETAPVIIHNCATDNWGTMTVVNNRTDPYSVELNNVTYGTVYGTSSASWGNIAPGTYSLRATQVSGFILYATVLTGTVVITQCGTATEAL